MADVQVDQQLVYDGLHVERLSWQLPYGPRTEAVFLKPATTRGRLPAVLGLHDHGGNKFFGHPKITRIQDERHPMMAEHQVEYYGGVAWANELAKRGYAVLVHDAYAFGSRRVRLADLSPAALGDVPLVDSDSPEDIQIYNAFAGQHEHLMAKSLFCAGTTWPGVFTVEDQRALDYLSSRPDVDPQRLGCGGLSGGGLRTVYLAGLDERIRCACCVGMMTTWRDYLLNTAHTHTWMIYIPGLPLDLDYPEILGAGAAADAGAEQQRGCAVHAAGNAAPTRSCHRCLPRRTQRRPTAARSIPGRTSSTWRCSKRHSTGTIAG